MVQLPPSDGVAAIAAIRDPLRRSLFDFVARSGTAIDRDEAAREMDTPRATAAFHLDRLVEAGLLTVEFQRRSGKVGPGAGRPSKLYRRSPIEVSVSIPERHYDLMGDILADTIEQVERSGQPAHDVIVRVATQHGREAGAAAASFPELLESAGYEPRDEPGGDTVMANCPFHRLAKNHTALICQANLALLRGAAETTGYDERSVLLDPHDGRCCVRLVSATE